MNCSTSKISSIIREIVDRFSGIYENKKIIFDKETHPVLVRCDHGIIERVLINLIGNSLKFISSNGEILDPHAAYPTVDRVSEWKQRQDARGIHRMG